MEGSLEKSYNLVAEAFLSHRSHLLAYVGYRIGNADDAEDLVQDVFVKLWETRERWRAVADFSAYVYQMVRYRCFNYLRGERLRDKAVEGFAEEIDVTEINGYIAEETFRIVRDAMQCLPSACRKVFELVLEGYKAKEIAGQLGIAEETVKKQKQIARKILKEQLIVY